MADSILEHGMRVQFDFSDEALQTLDTLRDRLSLNSRADVIRYSLRILSWLVEQLQQDAKIIVEKNGRAQEVVFPFVKIPATGAANSAETKFASVR